MCIVLFLNSFKQMEFERDALLERKMKEKKKFTQIHFSIGAAGGDGMYSCIGTWVFLCGSLENQFLCSECTLAK